MMACSVKNLYIQITKRKFITVMVNNSTNINKIKNHLSPKESLNSDGKQFHQYQEI